MGTVTKFTVCSTSTIAMFNFHLHNEDDSEDLHLPVQQAESRHLNPLEIPSLRQYNYDRNALMSLAKGLFDEVGL